MLDVQTYHNPPMPHPISDLTYKVVAYRAIEPVDSNESIDWAVEMMLVGYESQALDILAGILKPTTYREVIDYVEAAVRELGLQMKTGEDALLSYASYYLRHMANGQEVKAHLKALYKFYTVSEPYFEPPFHDFYRLYWAWHDIDYFEQHPTGYATHDFYWAGSDKTNIESFVIGEAKKWMERYKERLALGSR